LIKENKIVQFTEHQKRLFIEETALFISSIAKEIQEVNYQMEILVFEIHSNNGKMFFQQIVSQLLVVSLILHFFSIFFDFLLFCVEIK
jgi:hypothetical protein